MLFDSPISNQDLFRDSIRALLKDSFPNPQDSLSDSFQGLPRDSLSDSLPDSLTDSDVS